MDRFYCEKIYDLENKHHIDIKRTPSLSVDWGNRALDDDDIARIALSFACIPGADSPKTKIFDYYYGGLTFMGINDINFQCEDTAFANFYLALKEAAVQFGKVGANDISSHLSDVFGNKLTEELENALKLGEEKVNNTGKKENYDLGKVAIMKILCDSYLLKQFRLQKNVDI